MQNFKTILNTFQQEISHKLDAANQFLLKQPLYIYLIILILLFIKETKQFIIPQFWAEGGRYFLVKR